MKFINKKYIIIFVIFFAISCNEQHSNGVLYITEKTNPGAEIIKIKILENSENEAIKKNIFTNSKQIIRYKDFNWYKYEIPHGIYEIYIEYINSNGKFCNERIKVYINENQSENEWIAIWLMNNCSVGSEQGNNKLNIKSSKIE